LRGQISDTIDHIIARVTPLLPKAKILRRALFYFKLGKDGKLFYLW
jgi:hypothetical protein